MLVSVQTRFSKVNVGCKNKRPPTFGFSSGDNDFVCWKNPWDFVDGNFIFDFLAVWKICVAANKMAES